MFKETLPLPLLSDEFLDQVANEINKLYGWPVQENIEVPENSENEK
ncbi:hypothetical protein [Bacillus sp. CECT 9360]|nr:hypothetical protein [Bacillus sp. CECT 9360]CAH0346734.1 hypothetical protein BCI9360_03080 [Bacillus sp. CECT 9360]